MCRNDPSQKGRYIKIILTLLGTNNTSVIYECANTLVALSSAPTAIKAAANCYCQLLVSQSDNNVKLIVLDRIAELKDAHRYVMQEMVMDILRAVSTPNVDICKKALDIVLDLVTGRNIDEVVAALKKEIHQVADGHRREGWRVPPDARAGCAPMRGSVPGCRRRRREPAHGLSRRRQHRDGV